MKRTFFPFGLVILFSLNIHAQSVLTIGEVFNFEIGDEFHYKKLNATPNATRVKIVSKYFSEDGDTVFYEKAYDNYSTTVASSPETHLVYSFWKDTVTEHYTALDQSIFSYGHYDTLYKYWGEQLHYDSIVEESSSAYCDVPLNGFQYHLGDFEADYYEYRYAKGLGNLISRYKPGAELTYHTDISLSFYSKGDVTCGTPDVTTGNLMPSEKAVYIFPNPTSHAVFIRCDRASDVSQVVLYDVNGRVVKTASHHASEVARLDIDELPPGVYVLRFVGALPIAPQCIVKW